MIGDLDTTLNKITNLILWTYSGFEDSSYCAHATINESENVIVFSKIGSNTKKSDLYLCHLVEGSWSKPESIPNLNTDYDEMYPLFSGDSILSFSSNGRIGYGSLDIFISPFDGINFGSITHLESPVNSFSDDFNYMYLSDESAIYASNRIGGKGDDDVYQISFKIDRIALIDSDLLAYEKFASEWTHQNVYFNFDKYDVKRDVLVLDQLVVFLIKDKTRKILIEGHTDSRGVEVYNDYLGNLRAEVVKKEFLLKGVSEDQIVTVSKGNTDPPKKCVNHTCTEEEHALNRVAIIKLITTP